MVAGPHFLSIVCHFKSFTTFKKGDSLLLMHSLFHVCLGGKPEEKQINQYIQWSRALIVSKGLYIRLERLIFVLPPDGIDNAIVLFQYLMHQSNVLLQHLRKMKNYSTIWDLKNSKTAENVKNVKTAFNTLICI